MEGFERFQGTAAEDEAFKYALAVSCVIHLCILVPLSIANAHHIRKVTKAIEVKYQRLKLQQKEISRPVPKNTIAKEDKGNRTQVALGREVNPVPFAKDVSKLSESRFELPKKLPAEVVKLEVKRKVSVPPLKSEKINNPIYQDYYQIVRGRIKDRAYANYSKLDSGEVYLTFVIVSDGTLKQVKIIDERTKANEYLKTISLKSIQESMPFPPFPPNLSYPELSFNVVISFELEE
ncbi:MAG TPA: hypothetical protein PL155_06200 [Candidatus Omnitrophota bacterium]|nr:hypothetical protein [Candidatus Omnitrophota bacterium]HPD83929.1 hypothetical protein [Candidatus Omnitrophota bacterium]HRZ02786.1 hypothetical protein [Candidatus Omnitrophota bacterium]